MDRLPLDQVSHAVDLLAAARDKGRYVYVFGNGGAASTASHFACDLGKGASIGRSKRFRVRALGEGGAWSTALANDKGFDDVFVEELRNFLVPGDVCVALSASGDSANVIRAVRFARGHGASIIGVFGGTDGRLASLCDAPISVTSGHMGRIEDVQLMVCHAIAYHFIEGG